MAAAGNPSSEDTSLWRVGYQKAVELLQECATEHGFLASPSRLANYNRVWGRDGGILSLAAIRSEDPGLIETARATLETLIRYQGPHGEIPSNVDPVTDRVSYGGTAGRVDADLWFLIAVGEYWIATEDEEFLTRHLQAIEKVRHLLGAWEFNTRGFLYIPFTGDWADEYVHTGYVLYDQVLYLQAQREIAVLHRHLHDSADHSLVEKIRLLKKMIHDNFWFSEDGEVPDHVYHKHLYKKGMKAANRCLDCYWAPFFTPAGYGYRFDTFANTLTSLTGVSSAFQCKQVDKYIERHFARDSVWVLPAFHPVITPKDEDWEDLQMTFSYTFKNKPYEYHNGGLWPLVTGFYAADLAMRGREDVAHRYLEGVHRANSLEMEGEPWSFPEYLHGKKQMPEGTHPQGWSAAAAVLAQKALEGKPVFCSQQEEGD